MASRTYSYEVRTAFELTQTEFAQLFDVHPMTVSKWERQKSEPSAWQTAMMRRMKNMPICDRPRTKVLLVEYGAAVALVYAISFSKPLKSERVNIMSNKEKIVLAMEDRDVIEAALRYYYASLVMQSNLGYHYAYKGELHGAASHAAADANDVLERLDTKINPDRKE